MTITRLHALLTATTDQIGLSEACSSVLAPGSTDIMETAGTGAVGITAVDSAVAGIMTAGAIANSAAIEGFTVDVGFAMAVISTATAVFMEEADSAVGVSFTATGDSMEVVGSMVAVDSMLAEAGFMEEVTAVATEAMAGTGN